jgi:hypothetical protein
VVAPGVASDQKDVNIKCKSESITGGSIYVKNVKFHKMLGGRYPPVQTSIFWALPQKLKFNSRDFLAFVMMFTKRVSTPCRTKTQGGDRFSRNRPFSA